MIELEVEISAKVEPRTVPVGQCPACRASGARFFFKTIDRLHGVPGEYTYRRCTVCRTVFQDPRVKPDDLALCYPSQYFTHVRQEEAQPGKDGVNSSARIWYRVRDRIRLAITASVQGVPLPGPTGQLGKVLARSRRLRERAFHNHVTDELIPRAPSQLKALDVGCGAGYLISALQRVGWEVEGVEWDPAAAAIARRSTGCRVWQGDFRNLDLPLGAYDLVVLSHVFEHLDEPMEAVHRIAELLRPEGRGVLIFPNPRSLGAIGLGARWFAWEAPRHLVLPTTRAIKELAGKTGLTCEARTSGRLACGFFSFSRHLKLGENVDFDDPRPTFRDSFLGALERGLVLLGFSVGEEVIAALRKRVDLQDR